MQVDLLARPRMATPARFAQERGFVRVNPSWRQQLDTSGLHSAADFLAIPGEVISGHPDRHVMRVRVGEVACYLKREHRVPFLDRLTSWRAGFGFVSVSCREAAMLDELHKLQIPSPEWLAAGEDGAGRAFLLLREVPRALDLRRYARALAVRPSDERRQFARRLGRLLAELHDRGIVYPDLYAKHTMVDQVSGGITLIDWQRARIRAKVSWRERCRELAALNASLADDLAGPAERRVFLLAYLRHTRSRLPEFATICRRIERRTAKLLNRSSIREQRLPVVAESQPLIWLDGEALCVTPRYQVLFKANELQRLAYSLPESAGNECRTRFVRLRNGAQAQLMCRRTIRRAAQVLDAVRQRHWLTPEAHEAAALLRRERLGESPRLLAFGQRSRSWRVIDSFLLVESHDEGAE